MTATKKKEAVNRAFFFIVEWRVDFVVGRGEVLGEVLAQLAPVSGPPNLIRQAGVHKP